VRRAGVDDAHGGVVDHGHRVARRGVGQAQDGDVAFVERAPARRRVLAQVHRQCANAKFAAAQAVLQVEAGGALVAVDEDIEVHGAQS
jgi:hypothetical protein